MLIPVVFAQIGVSSSAPFQILPTILDPALAHLIYDTLRGHFHLQY